MRKSLSIELVVSKYLEYLVQVLEMLMLVLTVDKDVIEVDNDKLVKQGLEDTVHERHEGCWRVGETESQN